MRGSIGQKLRERAQELGFSDAEVARRADLNPRRYGNYVNDERQPDFATLLSICTVLDCSPDYLFGLEDAGGAARVPALSRGPDSIEFDATAYQALPVFDVRISAGPGALVDDHSEPAAHELFRVDWLRQTTGANPSDLVLLRVSGDSMWPTLHDGDQAMVNLAVQVIGRDGLYVIRQGDDLQVKRLSLHPTDGTVTVQSDNAQYRSYEGLDPEAVPVVGRVLWIARSVG